MKLLRNYFFWTYERGSFHYDVMVTLILLFLFLSPRFIDFKDRPVTIIPLQHSEVLVKAQGVSSDSEAARFTYEIRVDDLHGAKTVRSRPPFLMSSNPSLVRLPCRTTHRYSTRKGTSSLTMRQSSDRTGNLHASFVGSHHLILM
jgi:hypothetical protein